MRKIQLYIACIVLVNVMLFISVHAASDENETESVIDYFQLKNPFISFLPKAQIIKTPVEQPKQTINNSNQNDMLQMMPQQVVRPETVVLPAINIQGIVYGVKEPLAIIGDQTYGIGSVVQGATIKSIGKKGIKFMFSGREFQVALDD